MNWPEQIEIPDRIGTGTYSYLDGDPCCAIGHINKNGIYGWHREIYRYLYIKLTKRLHALGKLTWRISNFDSVEKINDLLEPKNRLELYLLTWAKLGYTEGMPPDILELLALPEIQNILMPNLESSK